MTSVRANAVPSRKVIAAAAVAAVAWLLCPPLENFKNAYAVHRDSLGNGYQAVCPRDGSNFYQMLFTSEEIYTALDWVHLIWVGPNRNQKTVAFFVRPQRAENGDIAAFLNSEQVETHRGIALQVSGGRYDATVKMVFNGRQFLLDGFGIVYGDSPDNFSARQVRQILAEIADVMHHCMPTIFPA
ncbi:hypothetical protein [Rhizobium sp. BK176]|uniref:hypothetical protein n=1 Tax=Rhizobium sp. BK176 TaxID=2587071 RepID=UPI002168462D|nr:hypothetical protein [Rhizobium sp. BK176]MCS4089785.1 hypothetical protein [Rhizobium sp. BK176]